MNFPKRFIHATARYSDPANHVPAPYFRKTFHLDDEAVAAHILICGLGFYRLYINGHDVTKGFLAPYISNPDDILYYDSYDIANLLCKGDNLIGICLGNGFQNNPGGHIWEFDKAIFRASPQTAFAAEVRTRSGQAYQIVSDETVRTADSPILFDDYRYGEYYDARRELPGWNRDPDFDDSRWINAMYAPNPRGECRLCLAEPIVVTHELKPVAIDRLADGWLYDFGINGAGVCRLQIDGSKGQEITLYHGEHLIDGQLDRTNISFSQKTEIEQEYVQKSLYICSGEGTEMHTPDFVYNGFRYVHVKGIDTHQATPELLTYLMMNSRLEVLGDFSCSDEIASKLQVLTRNSDLSNFFYFPTDCPQREKNGWTGDAPLSAEQMLLNLGVEKSFEEWLHNIRKSQMEDGRLPGIIPTAGWGYKWGNGPAWDCVLTYLPYFTYLYRGEKQILEQSATAIFRYLHYITLRQDDDGLLAIGLGDWCPPGRLADDYEAPLILTDSIIAMDICDKAAYIFDRLHLDLQRDFANGLYIKFKKSIRAKLIGNDGRTAAGNCQTSQAMAIFYHVFEEDEMHSAFEVLLRQIADAGNHFTTGILGGRVIFHVLSRFGYSDLAFEMITRTDFPSYGNWIVRGATTLWETFQPEGEAVASLNHHFWGDISSWFIRNIAGIQMNPDRADVNEVQISPSFITSLEHAEGYHISPAGRIEVSWKRIGTEIVLQLTIPEGVYGEIILPDGFAFTDTSKSTEVHTGLFIILEEQHNKVSC